MHSEPELVALGIKEVSMGRQENEAALRKLHKDFTGGNVEAALSNFSDDAIGGPLEPALSQANSGAGKRSGRCSAQ